MLMFGTANVADMLIDRPNTHIYNFTSLAERYSGCRLGLIPPNNLGANSEYDFDGKYANWIMSINQNFIIFMTVIIDLYNGLDVFLIVSEDNWSEMLLESLLKLIQQRYGINAVSIKDLEDLYYAKDEGFDVDYGQLNLDQDKERYQYLYEQYRIQTGQVTPDDYNI